MAQELSDGSRYFQFYARIALSYLASATKIGKEGINQIVENVDNETIKNDIMNFIEEFKLEGEIKGKVEGKTGIIRNLISKLPKATNKEIAELSGVTVRFVAKVRREMKQK